MYRYSRNRSPPIVDDPFDFGFAFDFEPPPFGRSAVLLDSAELEEVIVWSPWPWPAVSDVDDVYDRWMTRGNENRSRNCSANSGSVVDSLELSLDPLLSPVEQSPPPPPAPPTPPPPPEEREAAFSSSLRRANRAFSNSATENMLALVSCELKRRSFGLLPSRPPADVRICSGRFVCELKVELATSELPPAPVPPPTTVPPPPTPPPPPPPPPPTARK
uniref:Uncharacterized protein n=1 Tax=Anopheles farauti TaxID=69004 RepID=A0A182QXJ8_9DIPT